jgi:hypothetical protein
MTNPDFMGKLDSWARQEGLSYTVSYWEASDEYEVQVHSAAKSEEFYVKRVYNFELFLEFYRER